MKVSKKILLLFLIGLLISACGNLLDDFESSPLDPLSIDQEMCKILNELESITASTFNIDSLTEMTIFDSLVQDSFAFLHLSNKNNWEVPIDSSCYFILYAPQEADSYFVAFDISSEFHLYGGDGNRVEPNSKTTSLRSIAGCPDIRVRQTFSQLSGVYLAKLVNPNVSSVKMVIMNTNNAPIANFSTSTSDAVVGDSIMFTDESSQGSYPIVLHAWNFGDNNSSTDSSVVFHAYNDSGVYSPSLTVSDGYLFHTLFKNAHISVSEGNNE